MIQERLSKIKEKILELTHSEILIEEAIQKLMQIRTTNDIRKESLEKLEKLKQLITETEKYLKEQIKRN